VGDSFVEDFLHGQRDDDFADLLEEAADLALGVAGLVEGDEEPSRRRDSRGR
jgi:uncharacterized circularly permuted ATP-grasp superfamily protein